MFLNRRHANKREALGKTAQRLDESMMRKGHMENSKAVELEENIGDQHQRDLDADNGLHDVTDLDNEDFIYVY